MMVRPVPCLIDLELLRREEGHGGNHKRAEQRNGPRCSCLMGAVWLHAWTALRRGWRVNLFLALLVGVERHAG